MEVPVEDEFVKILSEIDWEEDIFQEENITASSCEINLSQVTTLLDEVLLEIKPGFNFYSAANDLVKERTKVSELSSGLFNSLNECLVKTSKISGMNREASQKAFFEKASKGKLVDLTRMTQNHQLTMWIALQVFNRLSDDVFSIGEVGNAPLCQITSEECDIAHYIGGCVIKKLEQRSNEQIKEVLGNFVSYDKPQQGTLIEAKTRGCLLNITSDAKNMFIEFECVFRDMVSKLPDHILVEDYISRCISNSVIQNCFHNSTAKYDVLSKELALKGMLKLYFKIRIHHKCRIILDNIRFKTKTSSKDRSLRSKLSK